MWTFSVQCVTFKKKKLLAVNEMENTYVCFQLDKITKNKELFVYL